ncbi:MAG: hypothetical protein GX789_07780 [Pseudomonas formosensis]|nr:hypothetical protein [Halopseudomonas formosensis]
MLLILASLYVVWNRHESFEAGAVFAIVFAAIYLTTYLFIPPVLEVTSMRLGLLFGYVPLVSLAAVLFPELNPSSPVPVTRFLGWVGLVVVFLILCVMKIFVW